MLPIYIFQTIPVYLIVGIGEIQLAILAYMKHLIMMKHDLKCNQLQQWPDKTRHETQSMPTVDKAPNKTQLTSTRDIAPPKLQLPSTMDITPSKLVLPTQQ